MSTATQPLWYSLSQLFPAAFRKETKPTESEWKFNFQHRIKRNDNRQLRPYYDLGPKSVINGVTTCVITAPDGTIGIGTAICGAGDKFSRDAGRNEAASYAIDSLPPELRLKASHAYSDFEDSEE